MFVSGLEIRVSVFRREIYKMSTKSKLDQPARKLNIEDISRIKLRGNIS